MPEDPYAVKTYLPDDDELRRQAQAEVDSEIGGQVGPLEGQIGSISSRESSALKWLQQAFSGLLPFAAESAQRTAQMGREGMDVQRGIFSGAQINLQQFKEQRAAAAQRLAQQIGADVPVDIFTGPVDQEAPLLAATGAGGQLQALGQSQADTQAAEDFAGKVFPLQAKESYTDTQRYFEDQISEIRKDITNIKSQKGNLTTKRLGELKLQERTYALQRAQANRDFYVARQQLAADKKRISIAQQELAQRKKEAGQTYDVNKQNAATAADQNKVDRSRIAEQRHEFDQQFKLDRQKMGLDQRTAAMDILDGITEVTVPQISEVQKDPEWVPGDPVPKGISPRYVNGKWHWYEISSSTQQVTAGNVATPDAAYNTLRQAGIPKERAITAVRTKFGVENWVPPSEHAAKPSARAPRSGK